MLKGAVGVLAGSLASAGTVNGAPREVKKRKPKTPKPKAVEDYDLGPLLYCPNVACRSEHLQTKANGKKYCTKCNWNK